MSADHVLLGLALALNLYLSAVTLARVRLLSAQMAALTMRFTDLAEQLDRLDTDLRTVVQAQEFEEPRSP